MKTCLAPIACAAIRQPSMKRCGTRRMISRSLKAPGSDSSALATTYVGLPAASGGWTRLSLRPIGKPAPPRPRSVAVEISSITACRSSPRALVSAPYPPIAWYSSSRVRSRSSAPARTMACASATLQLLCDAGHVLRLRRLPIAMVDDDDRRIAAPARALDRAQRDLAVLARLADADSQLALEGLDDLLRSDERAGDVRADLDEMLADRGQVVHVIEGRDRLHMGRSQVERVGHLRERLRRQPPAVLLLRQPQAAHHPRPGIRVRRGRLKDLLP